MGSVTLFRVAYSVCNVPKVVELQNEAKKKTYCNCEYCIPFYISTDVIDVRLKINWYSKVPSKPTNPI